MIGCGIDTHIDKFLSYHFGVLAGETVDDACFFRMITDEAGDVLELCLFGALLSYGEGEVGAVETAYERLPIEMKLAYDIFARYLVGCGCERHHRDIAEILVQHTELRILRTEIVSPLADAVGLVNGKERNLDVAE